MKPKPLTEKEFFKLKAVKAPDCWAKIAKWLKTDEAKQFEKDLQEIKH